MVFISFIQQQGLELLAQIMEEGIIFALLDANQGDSETSKPLISFLELSLDLIDLALNNQLIDHA
jgi:hypothetical protein